MNNTLTENERLVSIAKEAIASAEKLCIENKHPMLLIFARAIVEYDKEIQRLKDMQQIAEDANDKKITAQCDEITTLRSEVSALKEKYRWRKQSEEPAPSGIYILEYMVGCEMWVYRVDSKKSYCRPRSDSMWRPLELTDWRT